MKVAWGLYREEIALKVNIFCQASVLEFKALGVHFATFSFSAYV
jgi:hypothetical protein